MSKSYLHSIAIFIATLMITLPIYAASANAFITNPRAFGTDEINGFFEENDPIQIEITASIAGDPDITRDQVRFALPNLNVQPEDCPKNADGTTTCASTISQNELGANPENVAIPVTLFDNFGNTDDTDSLIITLDNQPPQITAISSTVLSNGNVRFDFTIKDTANANTARCVGFKAIEITGTSTTTKTLSVDACEISTFISILPSTFTTRTSGIAQVTATLIDKFDQRSQPVSVNVDVTPPAPAVIQSVGDGSLTNLQIQGNDQIIGFVRSGEAIGLVVTARIDGDASIIRQQLEIQLPGGNIPFQQDCSQGNGFFQCVHQVSAGNIGNTKVISIPVTLRNDANQLVASETFNGVVDELPPVASNIAVAFTTNRKIRIQFDVTEKANTQTTQCVGLESVSVVGSAGLKTVPLSVNSCTLSTFVLLDALDVISELRGQHTISIQVNDKFGQSSNSISAVLDLGNGIPLGNNVVATLTNVQVHDSNNINGFIADTNPITLEVTARITSPNDDDTILKKQMQLFRNGQFEPFQNCVPTTDGFHDCSTLLSQSNVNGKSFSLSGSLITDIGEIGPSVIFKGVIDEEDPEIIAIESNLTLARDLRFKANIKDFAHQGSSECVGIKEINFTNGNLQEIKQISVDSCDFTQTFTLPGLSIVPIFQGKHTVTAIVKDKFGHTSKPATYDLDFKQGIRISSGIDTELSNAYVRGSRGISRYVGDGETVRLSVIARTVGDLDDRIRPQQIELLLPSTGAIITFTNCLPKANGYFECTNDLPFSDLGGQKNFSLQATLITDIGEIGESLLLTGAVDEQPPQVLELTVSKSKVGNQKINFTFTVVDTADDTGKHCSGLKNVILSHGIFTKNIDIEEVSGSSSLCKFSSFVEVESSAISSAEEGIIEVKARAFDNFEQESAPAFVSFEVDRTEPEFDQNSFHVLDEEGDDIDFISADNQIATIIANFSDKELNIASIRGDFSSFNESNIKRAPNSCAFDGENASCIWTNILITVDTSNQFPISLEADDEFANELRVTFNHGLDVDTDAPELGVITSERVADNSIFFGKENNNLSVNIREEGVGFNKKEVFFDATALGASDSLQADTCVNLGGEFWNCIWNNVPNGCASDCTPEQQKTHDLFIRPESSDDIGNLVTGERAFNVTVDTTAPIINTITSSPEAPKAGDTLTFSITITENFPKTTIIKVNTSTISVLPEHTGTCNAQGLCEVPVSSLLAEFREENLKFIAIDAARNQADKVNEITIFQGDPNNVPAFFRISLRDVVPKKIERQVASQVNVPVFVNLEVETFGSGVVISKGVTCLDSANILSETPFFLSENSDNPIISLKTNTILGSFENDATIICQVALTVRNSTTIFALPELENITIDLELFGSRLGDPNVVAQAQLDNLNQEIKDLEDSIENMEKWVTLFGTWCTIAQTMGQLNSLIQGIKMLMYGVTTGAWFACLGLLVGALPCTKKVEAKWAGAHCLPGGAFHNTVELLFWPSGPISVPTLGLITKYGCMITFHCALCDWTTYLNLAASYVGGALNAGLVGTNGILKPLDRRSALNTATAEDLQKAFDTKTEGSDDIGLEDLNGDPVPVKSVITKDRVTTIQFKDGGKISLAEGEELGLKNEYKFRPGAEGVKTRLEALGEDKKTKFTVKNKDNLLKIDGKSYYVANFHSKDDFFINAADGTTVTSHKNPELYGKLNTKWKATPPPPPGAQKPAPQGILARTNNRIRDTFDKSIKNAWTENLEATRLPEPDPGNWIFDPYKAEIYAMGCLCIPAILHSKQKERQITCLLRNCVTNKLTSSQETTECYDAYDERECLYIESAQVREHGASGIFDNLWEAVKSNLPYLIEGIAYLATCLDYVILSSAPDCAKTYALGVPVAGARPVLCGLWGGSQTIREIISVLGSKFSMNNYNQELKGPDYCTTGGTVEGQ